MQIVIEVPDGCYEELCNGRFPVQDSYRLVAWIKNGIVLPKNHGRLIDADELMCVADSDYYDGEYRAVSIKEIKYAKTIIPATEDEE